METKPEPIETILASLQKDAQKRKTGVIAEARLAITPDHLRLLEVQSVVPLAVIHY